MEKKMVRAILACVATVALAACVDPAHQVLSAQTEVQGMRNLAPQPPGRFPVGSEVLVFQNYGRTIADRASSDPNFGGFIFRSEPEPHAIVMFTGDAEARLRRYTRDPRFKPKRVDITLAELERMKSRTSQEMRVPGAQCLSVDADEEHNTVTVSGPLHELEMVRAAIAAGRFKQPPKFRLVSGSCVVAR